MIINNFKVTNKIKENQKCKHKVKNMISAFFFGGIIGMVAQGFYQLYLLININEENSLLLSSATIVFLSFLLTCFGVFDKLATIGKCGFIIPISGFANSITSSALEGKSEGYIFGIGSKMFSLVGSVITYGIVSSIVLGIIYYIVMVI